MNKNHHKILSVFLILMFSFFLLPANIAFAADNVSPIITLNGENTMTINEGGTYKELGADWTDVVDAKSSATVGTAKVGGDTVNTQKPGTYVITYNYTDGGGNAADQVTRTVIVKGIVDTTPPVTTPPIDNTPPVTTPPIYNTPPVISPQTDTTPPIISPYTSISVPVTSASNAIVTFTAIATDNIDAFVKVTSSPISGTRFPIGTTQVTLTARDAAGNVATPVIFNITVVGATISSTQSTTFIGNNVIIILPPQ